MARLARRTLADLDPRVEVPAYDPAELTPGIVHIGVGGFHRAHQAMYLDRLHNAGSRDWAICGVGLRPFDATARDAFAAQDDLYTLMEQAPDGTTTARVIGSITEYLFAPDDPAAVLAALDRDATRIVSLTITEGGYDIDDATGSFAPRDPDTVADLAGGWSSAPRSALGFIVAALKARKDRGAPAFTIMTCDNIPGNGDVARVAVTGFASRVDEELATWIGEHVTFPNSMVDRITPATNDVLRAELTERFGVEDDWPVRSETFTQWVLEDRFPAGRPELETVGVQFVDDVEPYELMKLRLLNASHQAIAYPAQLIGMTLVHEAAQAELFRTFLRGYMNTEGRPTLPQVPGVDLDAYVEELISRFSNEAVRDTLARLAFDGADRIPKFLLPVVRHNLEHGGSIRYSVTVLASWSIYVEGRTEAGEPLGLEDQRADELRAAASAEHNEPGAFLRMLPAVFGDLAEDEQLLEAFRAARFALREQGVEGALKALESV